MLTKNILVQYRKFFKNQFNQIVMTKNIFARKTTINESAIINYSEKICENKILPWMICFSASLFFFYQFLQMNSFNVIGADLSRSFGLTTAQLGNFSSFYLYGLAMFFIPAGLLLEYFSTRRLLLFACGAAVINTCLFSQTHWLWLAEMSRFLMGVTHAFAFLGCCLMASYWLPSRRALAIGCMVAVGLSAGVVAQVPLALLVTPFGWRLTFKILAGLGILIWIIMWFFIKDNSEYVQSNKGMHYREVFFSLKKVVVNAQNWFAALYTCLLNLPIILLGALWGTLYLSHETGLNTLQTTVVISMIYLGTIIGSPVIGWISDRMQKRKLPMILGAIFSFLIALWVIFSAQLPMYLLMVVFFLMGFFTSAQTLSYPLISEINPKPLITTALSFASVIIMGFGGVFQLFFGWLMEEAVSSNWIWWGLSNYQVAFILILSAFAVCCLLTLLIRDIGRPD